MVDSPKNNANSNGATDGASVPPSAIPEASIRAQTRVNDGGDENNDSYLPTVQIDDPKKAPKVGTDVQFRLGNGLIISGKVHEASDGDKVVLSDATTAKEGAK